jgi:transcriptional regulator with XRE-family HTH domain
VASHDVPLYVAFGLAVRRIREELGLSQEEVAIQSGLHRNHVGEIERAETNPTLTTVEVLSQTFGLSPSGLLGRAEQLQRK